MGRGAELPEGHKDPRFQCLLSWRPGLAHGFLAVPISDQGDGCTACPGLQGALTDRAGLPGKPGPKGDPGPEGVGRPGKPVSSGYLPSRPSLPGLSFSPSCPLVLVGALAHLCLLGPAWSTRSSRTPRTEGHTGVCECGGPGLQPCRGGEKLGASGPGVGKGDQPLSRGRGRGRRFRRRGWGRVEG